MAKINTLVLFSFLFGLVYSYGGTPQLTRKLNVRPTLREEPIVVQQPQPIITQTIDTTPLVDETIFTLPQQPVLVQQTVPSSSSYGSQQTISRDSLRKASSGLKKVIQKETVTTQTSSGYGLTPTLITVTVPPPMPVQLPVQMPVQLPQRTVVSSSSYGQTPQITRERPVLKETTTTFIQTPSGYSSSSSSQQQQQQQQFKSQSTISRDKLKIQKPLLREQVTVSVKVDPCTPNPCKNSGFCTKITDTTFTCTCTPYFFGDYCEFQQQLSQQVLTPVSSVLTPQVTFNKPSFGSIDLARETTGLTSCSQNPCLNEATCVEQAGSFFCQCPWGWSGKYCEICITDCASNPCGLNKKCRAFFGGGYECICPPDRTGPNCEIQNDVCSLNPCLNGGTCRASTSTTGDAYQCICVMPFAGVNCESEWTNPCTAEVLRNTEVIQFENPWDRTKYIICTDVDQWMTMSCSDGTVFSSQLGHCVPENYEAPLCPPKFCLNDGECMINEMTGELGCTCKAGFTGKNCEVNIDECQLFGNPCGMGQCVDQINTYYCYCPDGGIGLDCTYTIQNPCTPENLAAELTFFTILSADGDHYLRCADVNVWTVHRCAQGLFWDQQEKTCTIDKPADLTGQCVDGPCKNGGSCVDLGSSFKCMCKEGYAGDLCEQMIDYCASNPCMNGGRCLPYAGGYTCVCPDKIIDDCCCNGLINPCPTKEKLIPGVNNYYPHIFPHKYIHCDFDGRAFVRNCAVGTKWSQEALSCLPDEFILNTTQTIVRTPLTQTQTIEQTYTQLPQLTQTQTLNTQRVKLIKEMPKMVQKQTTTTFIQQPKPVETQSSYTQLPVLTQTIQKTMQLPKAKPLPVQKQTVTVIQTPVQLPVQTVDTSSSYNTLPQLTQTVPKPVLPIQLPVQQPTIRRTQVRVEEVPSSYNTLPTIERPTISRTIMETPSGYGSVPTTTTESTPTYDSDQTFIDGGDYNQEDLTQDLSSSDLTDTSFLQQQQPQQTFGRQILPSSIPMTQPIQQQTQQILPQQQSRTMTMTMQKPIVQSTPQRTMTQGRTLVQQPVQQVQYRRL